MKIECDKCGAKYSIADEKVRGKTFKIRCKKCSNVIIVRDVQESAAAPEPEEPAAVGWHLALEGETVGPLSEEDVRQRYDGGEIDKETAIWQEGFEDWITLGEADAFADLPDRQGPAASEDDPFSQAHEEDYSAPRAAGGGASLGAAMSEPADAASAVRAASPGAAEDPRVSSLTGQRNENSVLFSLDNLQAMATAGGGGAIAAAPKVLATAARSSEGSGLIDIRSMGSGLGSEAGGGGLGGGGAAGSVDDALPSFGGGGGFGGLAATPLVAQPASGEAAAGKRSSSLLYAMVGVVVLLLGAVGFLAYIVLTKEPEVKVVRQPSAAPVMKDAKDKNEDEAAGSKDEDEGEGEGDTGAGTGGGQEGVAGSGSSGSKRRTGRRKRKPSGGSSGSPTPAPSSSGGGSDTPSGSSGGGSDMDVDCILNPALPKCKKKKKKKAPSGGSSNPNLPEKITISQVKSGMKKVKPAAKSCGIRHGAKSGEKVKVKVSISGKSGRVISAAPQGPHAGKPLGNCVAAAAKKASFPKFKKSQMGVVYPFTM